MIIPKIAKLNDEQEKLLYKVAHEFKVSLLKVSGEPQDIYLIKGDERNDLMLKRLEGLDFVKRVQTIQSPYRLMDKGSALAEGQVTVGGKPLGKGHFLVFAGHCTIDPKNPSLFYETANAIKEAGGDVLRGGIWKPRTSPHSYQGDHKSLDILLEARERTGLPIITEVMDVEQLDLLLAAKLDVLQIGTRNALNYNLLKQVGKKAFPKNSAVLLKRTMHMGTADELILAAEYVVSQGCSNMILTPRGTIPALEGYRNHPDECITPILKEKTWAPIVVDPSHSVGHASYVPFSAMAATAYGADGLLIETNIQPLKGIGDDPRQAITPDVLAYIIREARKLHQNQLKFSL